MPRHLAPIVAVIALLVPAAPALASGGAAAPPAPVGGTVATAPASVTTLAAPPADVAVAAALQVRAERASVVSSVLRLSRRRAALRVDRATRPLHRRRLAGWSLHRLRVQQQRLRRQVLRLARAGGAPPIAIPPQLRAIARCESGGNPRAVDPSGTYRGLFQFARSTWAAVGGTGDPARATVLEQYRRAAMLYARSGSSPWPVCGR